MPARGFSTGLVGPTFVLGVALSGFFDGILLHQVLQWHHLLSLAPGAPRDVGFQILADGLFHVLMYVVALAGLVWLWRVRAALTQPGAARGVVGGAMLGFGAWNILDVGLFHWILRFHHVRLDTPDWLAWDVLWFVVLGVAPAVVGWIVLRGRKLQRGVGAALVLAAVVSGAGLWSALPPVTDRVTVVFGPGVDDARMMEAAAAVDGQVIEVAGPVLVLELANRSDAWRLYRHGAWMVSAAGPSGCLNWAKTQLL